MATETAINLGAFARDLRDEDLLECLDIHPGRIGDELAGRERAVEIWKSLVKMRSFDSTVIQAARQGNRIMGFGSAVFVSRVFADAELSDPRRGLNSRIIASIDSGCSVVLSEAELRSANTRGGLDMVILHTSWRRDLLNPEGVSEICATMSARFIERHLGYRFNRLIMETAGVEEAAMTSSMYIWRLVSNFDEPGRMPRALWVITKEEALRVAGSLANPLFHHREPVLGLRDADQQLLLAALEGLTDHELSLKLGLSLTGVKKRWSSIFERTIEIRPDLFPGLDGNDGRTRGLQKRHHVLAHVRAHPEELRPRET